MNDFNEPDRQLPGKLAALAYRDFRLFWSGQLVSNIGTWMQMTATSWLLYQLTGSAVLLGLNGIFRAIPALSSRYYQRHIRGSLRSALDAALDSGDFGHAVPRCRPVG